MEKYIVIGADTIDNLEKEVNALLSSGWECQGGILYGNPWGCNGACFFQAMIKR